jgi:hypothetical protein
MLTPYFLIFMACVAFILLLMGPILLITMLVKFLFSPVGLLAAAIIAAIWLFQRSQ